MADAGNLETAVRAILASAPARRRTRDDLNEDRNRIVRLLAAYARRWEAWRSGQAPAVTPTLTLQTRRGPKVVYLPAETELLPEIKRLRNELRTAQKRLDQARRDRAKRRTLLKHVARRWVARMKLEQAKAEFASRRLGVPARAGRKLPPPPHALADLIRQLFDLGLPEVTISQLFAAAKLPSLSRHQIKRLRLR